MKFKIITGYTSEQHYTIDSNELHKAYYLFLNPEQRGIFKNGLAIIGKNIQTIQPDYNATMGWHSTHQIDSYDMEEIRSKGIEREMLKLQEKAKQIVGGGDIKLLDIPLKLIPDVITTKTTEEAILLAKQFKL